MFLRFQASISKPVRTFTTGVARMLTTPPITTKRRCSLTSLAAERSPAVARVPVAWAVTTSRRKRRTRASKVARTRASKCNNLRHRTLISLRRSTAISLASLSARSPKAIHLLKCKFRWAYRSMISPAFCYFLFRAHNAT